MKMTPNIDDISKMTGSDMLAMSLHCEPRGSDPIEVSPAIIRTGNRIWSVTANLGSNFAIHRIAYLRDRLSTLSFRGAVVAQRHVSRRAVLLSLVT
jgi:hypothetical protein